MSRIVFPRFDPPEEGVHPKTLLGVVLMLLGSCGGCYIAPVPLLFESGGRDGGIVNPLWVPLAALLLLVASLLILAFGYRLYVRSKAQP